MKSLTQQKMVFCSCAVIISLLFLCACGNKDLTRDEAKEILSGAVNLKIDSRSVPLQQHGFKKGINQQYWCENGKITSIGKPIFESLGRGSVTLVKGLNIEVSITGIRSENESGSIRTALFDWHYIGVPSIAKRFIADGGRGMAEFRLYDDGWRIDKLKIDANREPVAMSDAEKEEEAQHKAKIEAKRSALKQNLSQLEAQYKQLNTEAQGNGKTLLSMSWNGGTNGISNFSWDGKVTSTGVFFKRKHCKKRSNKISYSNSFWVPFSAFTGLIENRDKNLNTIRINFRGKKNPKRVEKLYFSNADKYEKFFSAIVKSKTEWETNYNAKLNQLRRELDTLRKKISCPE